MHENTRLGRLCIQFENMKPCLVAVQQNAKFFLSDLEKHACAVEILNMVFADLDDGGFSGNEDTNRTSNKDEAFMEDLVILGAAQADWYLEPRFHSKKP